MRLKILLPLLLAGAALLTLAKEASGPPSIVLSNCAGCHGVHGIAQQPNFPRLAGLNEAYIQQQIKAYREADKPWVDEIPFVHRKAPKAGARGGPDAAQYMIGIAKALSEAEIKEVSGWYAAQKPAAGRPANPALVEQGQQIYQKGVPAQNILACQDCHGAQGQGMATFPRLAGQNAVYIVNQLANFRDGQRVHSAEMTSISKHLDAAQEQAVAVYLQSR
jgi:cytochrome c553